MPRSRSTSEKSATEPYSSEESYSDSRSVSVSSYDPNRHAAPVTQDHPPRPVGHVADNRRASSTALRTPSSSPRHGPPHQAMLNKSASTSHVVDVDDIREGIRRDKERVRPIVDVDLTPAYCPFARLRLRPQPLHTRAIGSVVCWCRRTKPTLLFVVAAACVRASLYL